jgi:hypothetical protein
LHTHHIFSLSPHIYHISLLITYCCSLFISVNVTVRSYFSLSLYMLRMCNTQRSLSHKWSP